jgi:outer membrane protein TolC
VRSRQAAVERAAVVAKTAADPLAPRLDLEAYVEAQGLGDNDYGAAAEGLGTLDHVGAHLGLVYELPFTSTRHRAEAARAKLSVESARAQLEQARTAVVSELEIRLRTHTAAGERLELAERTLGFAREQLTAEQARLDTGASTPLEVLKAEEEARAAELRVVRARAEMHTSRLGVDHLLGQLLTRYSMHDAAAGNDPSL